MEFIQGLKDGFGFYGMGYVVGAELLLTLIVLVFKLLLEIVVTILKRR